MNETMSSMSGIVSANEAARRLGLSEKTVRRWIASGKLKADKSGRSYRVALSEVAALSGHDPAHESGPTADTVQIADIHSAPPTADSMSSMSGIPELIALVDRLQAEARGHAEAAAMWQERAGSLADRLALSESKLLALSAPALASDARTESAPIDPSVTAPAPSVPLWGRLVAVLGLVGVVVLLLVFRLT